MYSFPRCEAADFKIRATGKEDLFRNYTDTAFVWFDNNILNFSPICYPHLVFKVRNAKYEHVQENNKLISTNNNNIIIIMINKSFFPPHPLYLKLTMEINKNKINKMWI